VVLFAWYLRPFKRYRLFRHNTEDHWHKRIRLKRFTLVTNILGVLADQQLVTGIGIVIAGLVRHTADGTTLYHVNIIQNLAALSFLAATYSLAFEASELESEADWEKRCKLEELSFSERYGDLHCAETCDEMMMQLELINTRPLNWGRVMAMAFFLILNTAYNVIAYKRCKAFCFTSKADCYAKLYDFNGCLPSTIIFSLVPWLDYIYAFRYRSKRVYRISALFKRHALYRLLQLIRSIKDNLFALSRICHVSLPSTTILEGFAGKQLLQAARIAQEKWFPASLGLWYTWNVFDLLDLKISNTKLLNGPAENQFGFGQIVPLVLLGLLPAMVCESWEKHVMAFSSFSADMD